MRTTPVVVALPFLDSLFDRVLGQSMVSPELVQISELRALDPSGIERVNLHDNDALWSMIAVLEYYARLYEAMPERIRWASEGIRRH
ncbi:MULTISPECIES: hypothetical protein [Paraburkholderia]|uniref:hypothetical protein n=1 Tax=Paraburkholderia TaxID=1822464 RepID=UPI0038B87411